ncbi:Alpha/Beta hydrolase protein [Desarmillaria tabescens]|uniref:Alpha/Beta hydrolase protein n=1 Tax=Armillaria tabescens TaxID=1929756 RepID=A0AA39MRN7_ARMTA|nr:Alpha/Beta hydrolase protein [Desarmillaria tabescens]KAK0444571.1 Alpha/Beta hydrolase protein [Desarmillaria tabescens]
MRILLALVAARLAALAYAVDQSPTSSLGPIVNLGYASYAGNATSPAGLEDGPFVFYGNIPYAQPPVGDLRWRAPRMLDEQAQTGQVADARGWGPPCLQRPAMVGIGSEVNIWKPKSASEGDALPVAVYIHGGGFYANSPQGFPLYDWIEQHGNLVGVSITYRLGLLGFLGGSLVAADGDLNVGLLDQRASLEWIQRHISKFGGDPDNVTVSFSGTRPVPFKRVVAQSIGYGPTRTEAEVEATFRAIVSATNRIPGNQPSQFAPVIEGPAGFLPGLPSRLIESGNFSTVEFIGGHCTNDGRTFAGGPPEDFVTDADIERLVFSRWPAVSNATMAKALMLYPSPQTSGSPFATQYDRAWTMAGEAIFTCLWNAPDTVLYNARPYLGAMHTSDLYYLFSAPYDRYQSEATLSQEAIKYWTSFASTGDPSSDQNGHVPLWEQYVGSDARRRMVLSRGNDTATASHMETILDDEIARCRFWMSEDVTAETRV